MPILKTMDFTNTYFEHTYEFFNRKSKQCIEKKLELLKVKKATKNWPQRFISMGFQCSNFNARS
jgi:hypothetical protein